MLGFSFISLPFLLIKAIIRRIWVWFIDLAIIMGERL
jgi:hypothetical protein